MLGDDLPTVNRRPERPVPLPIVGPVPGFCPRCRADGDVAARLCRQCGEALLGRGYCSTCEASWNRPVGAACPKHDVALDDLPPLGPDDRPDRPPEAWVTVATYGPPTEANAARIRLEAEGIMTFLDGARIAGSTLYQVATGGARLQVPESLALPARILLAQTWSARLDPDYADSPDDTDDDPWAGLAPDPGARRRAIMKVAILIFLFGPGLMSLLNLCVRTFGWFPW